MGMAALRLGDPAATYRAVDLAGRTGAADAHQLVSLLYDECVRALRTAAWAVENRKLDMRSERVSRATAILFALEGGLDFERGGDLSRTLATLYHGLRAQVLEASLGTDAKPFRDAAATLEDIGKAWASVRGA